MVRSPLTAARATFALKAGEWFRRGRLLMVSPVHGDYRRCQAEIPLIVLFRFLGPALGNALRFKLSEIGEKDRVDVILTNPPFGGEEEKGIQGNFPEDRQTSETALLFLQLIMRKLRRQPTSAGRPARAPVGGLSQDAAVWP